VKLCLASTHFLATLLKKEFNGEDGRTTVSQYLAQIEEASLVDVLKVDLFSLSLTSTAFSCFFLYFLILFALGNNWNISFMLIFIVSTMS
jgi:hypothetical protein